MMSPKRTHASSKTFKRKSPKRSGYPKVCKSVRSRLRGGALEDIPFIILKKGTLVYRAAPDICTWNSQKEKRKHNYSGTDKTGVYLASYPLQSLGMLVEYEKSMPVGVFRVTDDIELYIGKFSYRFITPERFYDDNNKFIPYVRTLPNENLNHVEFNESINFDTAGLSAQAMEIFIADPKDVEKLKLLRVYDVQLEKLHALFERYGYCAYAPYLQHFPIIECEGVSNEEPIDTAVYTEDDLDEIVRVRPFASYVPQRTV